MNAVLKRLTLAKGPHPDDWTLQEQRQAAAEIYREDDSRDAWFDDAIADIMANERKAIVEALALESPTMAAAAIGQRVMERLVRYPLDVLGETARESEAGWRYCQRRDADSRAEARLLERV